MGAVPAHLSGKVTHVVRQFRYFVVETVYLRRIADYRPERVQIAVELPLQVGRGFHFLFRPQVSGGLHQHDLLLVLQLLFRLVGIEQDHSGKHGVVLRLYFADTDAQQKDSYPNRPFHGLFRFYRARTAALRQRDMAIRAASPLLRSSIPAVTLFHTSLRV